MQINLRWELLLVLSYLFCDLSYGKSTLSLSLSDAEELGLKNSDNIKYQQSITEMSSRAANVGKSSLYPKLSIEGYYYNNSVLPAPSFGGGPPVPFGAHNNYGIGPVLTYTLFDGGKLRKNHSSLQSTNLARENDEKARKKFVLYQTRLAYFHLQFAIQSLKFTAASLKLAEDQGKDIGTKFTIGSASKLDNISAKKNILDFRLRFEQAQKNLSIATRDVLTIVRMDGEYDTSFPLPEDLLEKLPKNYGTPTMVLKVDEIERSLKDLSHFENVETPTNHPELESLQQMNMASTYSAESYHAGFYPNVVLYAKSIFQYPNVVVKEEIQQNSIGVNLSFPIFEGDLTRNQTQMARAQALSFEYQRKQRMVEIQRDWIKLHDNIKNLLSQVEVAKEEKEASREVRQLTYSSYLNGRSRYLDVQDANLRELQSLLQLAELESQILEQYSGLDYLAGNNR